MKPHIRFLLLFQKAQVHRDTDERTGWTTEIYTKTLFGVTYVMKEQRYISPPEHFNCRCVLTPEETVEMMADEI